MASHTVTFGGVDLGAPALPNAIGIPSSHGLTIVGGQSRPMPERSAVTVELPGADGELFVRQRARGLRMSVVLTRIYGEFSGFMGQQTDPGGRSWLESLASLLAAPGERRLACSDWGGHWCPARVDGECQVRELPGALVVTVGFRSSGPWLYGAKEVSWRQRPQDPNINVYFTGGALPRLTWEASAPASVVRLVDEGGTAQEARVAGTGRVVLDSTAQTLTVGGAPATLGRDSSWPTLRAGHTYTVEAEGVSGGAGGVLVEYLTRWWA